MSGLPRDIVIRPADWSRDRAALEAVRRSVFIDEQGVDEHEEWDEHDAVCHHLLAWTTNRDAVGTARLHPSGRVGRVAVLAAFRGRGVGHALMLETIVVARAQGLARLVLHAQVQALEFYRRLGFTPRGEEFLEAGIAHVEMVKPLK